ncbi:unnamed protein product [Cladocopium goreaui]|uniref:Uncharacterized protein n=1 Tax=Cladocopium goreaui TaxID=2562237 RepID=A0A9P1DF90_9DINO|nr:unnamed protein product [Cladocopium goreaui]
MGVRRISQNKGASPITCCSKQGAGNKLGHCAHAAQWRGLCTLGSWKSESPSISLIFPEMYNARR